jgi:hypothetical protein
MTQKATARAAEYKGRLLTPRIGAEWPGQGGVFIGIIKGEGTQPDYCLIAPTGIELKARRWGPDKKVPDAQSILDGLKNTAAMAVAGSDMAHEVIALDHAGFTDWYIASRNEARIAFAGAPELWGNSGWRWTSTQGAVWDGDAWAQYFGNGIQLTCHEGNEFPALVLRRIPIR